MVTFYFTVNHSFLIYNRHPVTIPKEYYAHIEKHSLYAHNVTVISRFGSVRGSVYCSNNNSGQYYQIYVKSGQPYDPLAKFKIGEVIKVEIKKEGREVVVRLGI